MKSTLQVYFLSFSTDLRTRAAGPAGFRAPANAAGALAGNFSRFPNTLTTKDWQAVRPKKRLIS
jgi:hypothetical protein